MGTRTWVCMHAEKRNSGFLPQVSVILHVRSFQTKTTGDSEKISEETYSKVMNSMFAKVDRLTNT